MIAEFQVFFRFALPGVADDSTPIQTLMVRAEREKQAMEIVKSMGVIPISVGPGRVVIDPHQQWFDRTQAGAYLQRGPAKIDELMAEGKLPKAKDGRPLFHRRLLDELANEWMGIQQWEANRKKAA